MSLENETRSWLAAQDVGPDMDVPTRVAEAHGIGPPATGLLSKVLVEQGPCIRQALAALRARGVEISKYPDGSMSVNTSPGFAADAYE